IRVRFRSVAAGAKGEDGAQRPDRRAQGLRARVRTEVPGAVADDLARVVRAGEERRSARALAAGRAHLLPSRARRHRVVHPRLGDLELQVVLVVLEPNVEARPVLLDARFLEDQLLT